MSIATLEARAASILNSIKTYAETVPEEELAKVEAAVHAELAKLEAAILAKYAQVKNDVASKI